MANNENEDPDALPDFEADGDFAEFEEGRPQASLGDTIRNNPLIKLGLVAAALIIVVGGIVLFGGEKEKAVNSQVGQSKDLKETPGTKELTPAMQEAMEIYNDQQLTKAVNTGDSVLPTPITPPKTFLPAPDDTTANEDPLQRWRQMQEERLRIQREQEQLAAQANQTGMNDPAVAAAIKDLAEAMSNNMVQIVSEKQPQPLHYMKIWAEQEGQGGEGGQGNGAFGNAGQAGVGANGATGTMAPPQPLDIVVAAGSIVYAQLLNEANSDVVGPIVALVAQGPFSGARVLGSFSRQEEYLVLQFNTLVTKDGYSVPIQTYALDPDTTLTGMATEVDHRYWKRIILPAAASFIQGIGEAIAESGTSVTVNNSSGTTTTQDSGSIDTKEELAKGVEKSFEKIGSMLDEEGNDTEPLVIVKAGSPLGLLFMQSVTKQAVDAAKYGSGMMGAQGQPGMPGQQQQTNPLLSLINGMAGQQQVNQFGQPVNQYGQPTNPLAQYGAQQQNAYPGLPPALLQALQQQQGLQNANQYSPQMPAQ